MAKDQIKSLCWHLYSFPEKLAAIINRIDESEDIVPTDEVVAAFQALEEDAHKRIEQLANAVLTFKAQEAACTAEVDRLSAIRRAAVAHQDRIKEFIDASLTAMGVEKLELPTVKVRRQSNSVDSISLAEGVVAEKLPAIWRKTTITYGIDTEAVKGAKDMGLPVPKEIIVERGTHLRIA